MKHASRLSKPSVSSPETCFSEYSKAPPASSWCMLWPGVEPPARKLRNCAAYWTNTKGTGDDLSYDDQSDELAIPEHDAFPGLDPAALSVARHGTVGAGRSSDDALSTRLRPLCTKRGGARSDARRAHRDVPLSDIFRYSHLRKVFCGLGEADRPC